MKYQLKIKHKELEDVTDLDTTGTLQEVQDKLTDFFIHRGAQLSAIASVWNHLATKGQAKILGWTLTMEEI